MIKKSIVLTMILYSSLNAGAVDSRYFYQDYLDFGANKGKFKAGTTNLTISPQPNSNLTISKPTDITLNAPMIDFGASNQTGILKGEFTNIGGNRAITAAHMIFGTQANSLHRHTNLQFGGVNTMVVSTSNNFYVWQPSDTTSNKEDFMVMRMSKVNLNKKAEVSPMKFYDENGNDINATACKGNSMCSDKSGKAELYKENNKGSNARYTIFARSGTGLQMINTVKESTFTTASGTITKTELEKLDSTNPISKAGEYFTGGFVQITENNSFDKNYNIHAESFMGNDNGDNELLKFSNTGAKGDSGSALYVYDNVDKKWYVVGVVSTSLCGDGKSECHLTNFHLVNNNTIDNFDKAHRVDTSAVLILDGTSLKDGVTELEKTMGTLSFKHHYKNTTDKTIYEQRIDAMENDKDIYISGGSLTLSADADLGSSTLIIKENLSKAYEIVGGYNFLHGGLDIGANSVVNYRVKTAEFDFLHKIGAGKLNIYSSSPTAGLRIGGGEVEFVNGASKAFGSVYMTNNSNLKIDNANQIDANYLYFGSNAGKLDLNGTSLVFNNFYASDNNAIITNTGTAVSNLSISKNLTKDNINHGSIKGNITINQNNNSSAGYSVYDGGLEVNSMEFKSGNLVFQGHPVVHEYVKGYVGKTAEQVAADIKAAGGGDVFTSPTRLNQEDWEDRVYKMTSLTLDNANLDILKHASVEIANINSTSSNITIGENLAYIDKFDGENIKANDTMGSDTNESYYGNLKYQEEVSSGYSKAQNIFVNSNFDLKTNSKLRLLNGTNYTGKITADSTSSLEFDGAIVNANINASSLNSSNTTYIYESTTNALNIDKATSGANNKLLIKKDFLNGADRLLLASLANSTLVGENYFSVEGESSVFATLMPNVKYYDENGVAKWYLEKITTPTPPDPNNPTDPDDKPQNPDPNNPTDPDDKPQNPDNPTPPIIKPLDPNPENNISNTETLGHYDEYFFVKENKESIQTAENSLNQIFFNYVLEWNNMQKRMGELRDDKGGAGFWLRAYGGESSYLDYNTTKYYEIQLGADKRTEFNGFVNYTGFMLSSASYELSSNITDGMISGYGGGIYSSFVYDNGLHIDMIAKYVGYKNDFSINFKNNNQTIATLSAKNKSQNIIGSIELGYRGFVYNGFYVEPSAELISGYVGKQKMKNEKEYINLEVDSFVPLNLKTMLSVGKASGDCDRFGFRAGVGYAADLVKNGDKTIRDINVIRKIQGKKDSRMLTSVGLNYKGLSNSTLNLEFEKTFFGDMNTDYAVNITLRKSF